MSKATTVFPELRWAQRSSATEPEKNKLWIIVAVPQLIDWEVDVTDTTFKFTGKDAERSYSVEFELYGEVEADRTRKVATQQHVAVELIKKVALAEYWPRLTKDTKRRPFIRTDFDKWVDEDEQDEKPEADDMFGGAGGFPGGAGGMPDMSSMMGGMGGAGGDGKFDMSQLEQLKQLMDQSGGDGSDGLEDALGGGGLDGVGAAAPSADNDDEENDEVSTDLGDARD